MGFRGSVGKGLASAAKGTINVAKKTPTWIRNNQGKAALIGLFLWGVAGDKLPSGSRMPVGYHNRDNKIEISKRGIYNSIRTNQVIGEYIKDHKMDIKNGFFEDDMFISSPQQERVQNMTQCALYDFTKAQQLQCNSEDDVEEIVEALHDSGGWKIWGGRLTLLPGREIPLLGNTRASDDINNTTTKDDIIQILTKKIEK